MPEPAVSRAPVFAGLPRRHYRLLEDFVRGFPDHVRNGALLAAVSGGADSMAMLELLVLAAPTLGLQVTAAYVDHGLRPEAAGEATLVRTAASRHGLGFLARKLSPATGLQATAGAEASEGSLRERRYRALIEMAAQCGGRWIATAHVHEDQVETILFRMLRGAGRRGLSGIPASRGPFIRPLLGVRRSRLRSFLRDCGAQWMEDPSNADLRYARNRLRHVVIPAIARAFGAHALDELPAMATRWRKEEAYLEQQTERYLTFATGADFIDLNALPWAPEALRPRLLRTWLGRRNGGKMVTLRQLSALERFLQTPEKADRIEVAGVRLWVDGGRLCVHND